MKQWILLSALTLSSVWSSPTVLAAGPTLNKPAVSSANAGRPAIQQVNINSADAESLASTLVGVGPAKARAIVEWRKKNGPYKSVAALADVKGIGPALIERNKDRIRLR